LRERGGWRPADRVRVKRPEQDATGKVAAAIGNTQFHRLAIAGQRSGKCSGGLFRRPPAQEEYRFANAKN
jgi:hypothetical protein